jgi:hypothetical protein
MTAANSPSSCSAPSQPLSSWDGKWVSHPASVEHLARLTPGASITVVKRAPDGSEATRYRAIVQASRVDASWVEVEAEWTNRAVTVAGLTFEPGDILREFFSPIHPYNAFAVISADGAHKGWYGNVTYPAFLLDSALVPVLVWHDLYLDVVMLTDGTVHLLDDDELDAAPPPFTEAAMYKAIHAARDDLLAFIRSLHPDSGRSPAPRL